VDAIVNGDHRSAGDRFRFVAARELVPRLPLRLTAGPNEKSRRRPLRR
jgi:hypothetical protein